MGADDTGVPIGSEQFIRLRQFRDTALGIPDFVRGVVRIGTISKSYRVRESVIADPMASRMSLPCQRCGRGVGQVATNDEKSAADPFAIQYLEHTFRDRGRWAVVKCKSDASRYHSALTRRFSVWRCVPSPVMLIFTRSPLSETRVVPFPCQRRQAFQ